MKLTVSRLVDCYQWLVVSDTGVSHGDTHGDLADVFVSLEKIDVNLTDDDMVKVEELEMGETFELPEDNEVNA